MFFMKCSHSFTTDIKFTASISLIHRYDVQLYNTLTSLQWQYDCDPDEIKGCILSGQTLAIFFWFEKINSLIQSFILGLNWKPHICKLVTKSFHSCDIHVYKIVYTHVTRIQVKGFGKWNVAMFDTVHKMCIAMFIPKITKNLVNE